MWFLDELFKYDQSLLLFLNSVVGHSWTADQIIRSVSHNYLFKGVVAFSIFWALWSSVERTVRQQLLAVLVLTIAAIVLGRLLAEVLPFRLRPIHDPNLAVRIAIGMPTTTLQTASAFPSDHAVMFFALAGGLWMINRLAGLIAVAHAAFLVCLPRICLGLHFPTDIIAGALLGVLMVYFFIPPLTRLLNKYDLIIRLENHRAIFYPSMFVITFEAASMFDSSRQVMAIVGSIARTFLT